MYEDIQEIYKKHYHKPYKRPLKISKEDYHTSVEIKRGYGFADLTEFGFTDVSMKLYDAARTFNADEYIALLETFSDHRILPDGDRAALYAGVHEAIQRHGGSHKVDYVFQLYMGRKL